MTTTIMSNYSYGVDAYKELPDVLKKYDFKKIAFGSIVISVIGSLAGLAISYVLNVPTGASVITVFVIMFLIARIVFGITNKRKQRRVVV